MGQLGPNTPTTLADDSSIGTVSLSNVANALVSDDTYTSVVLLLGQTSHFLKATGFKFAVPLDSKVDGIFVEIERSANLLSAAQDASVKLVKGGAISGTEKADGSQWPTTDTIISYGSSTDLWGQVWTPSDINSSSFGVAISATAVLGVTAQIDTLQITVFYTGSNRATITRHLSVGNMSTVDRAL